MVSIPIIARIANFILIILPSSHETQIAHVGLFVFCKIFYQSCLCYGYLKSARIGVASGAKERSCTYSRVVVAVGG